jgi:hypothetical protein
MENSRITAAMVVSTSCVQKLIQPYCRHALAAFLRFSRATSDTCKESLCSAAAELAAAPDDAAAAAIVMRLPKAARLPSPICRARHATRLAPTSEHWNTCAELGGLCLKLAKRLLACLRPADLLAILGSMLSLRCERSLHDTTLCQLERKSHPNAAVETPASCRHRRCAELQGPAACWSGLCPTRRGVQVAPKPQARPQMCRQHVVADNVLARCLRRQRLCWDAQEVDDTNQCVRLWKR